MRPLKICAVAGAREFLLASAQAVWQEDEADEAADVAVRRHEGTSCC